MPELFGFDAQQVRRIRAMLIAWEQGRLNLNPVEGSPESPGAPVEIYLGQVVGSIAALSGDIPGSGDVTLFQFATEADNDGSILSTGLDAVTGYNFSSNAIASNTYVVLCREPYSGNYIIAATAFPSSLTVREYGTTPIINAVTTIECRSGLSVVNDSGNALIDAWSLSASVDGVSAASLITNLNFKSPSASSATWGVDSSANITLPWVFNYDASPVLHVDRLNYSDQISFGNNSGLTTGIVRCSNLRVDGLFGTYWQMGKWLTNDQFGFSYYDTGGLNTTIPFLICTNGVYNYTPAATVFVETSGYFNAMTGFACLGTLGVSGTIGVGASCSGGIVTGLGTSPTGITGTFGG